METLLKYNWKFKKGNNQNAQHFDYDDRDWDIVRVPYDFAIAGPFSPENDKQVEEVIADGIMKPITHVGRTGGLPICEKAWYRRFFEVAEDTIKCFLEFDGVMSNSIVYVNGIVCGGCKYGYSSFSVDISHAVQRGKVNCLAVSVNPEPSSSRWYTGAGIYRNVRLIEKQEAYFPYCPVRVQTCVREGIATIDVDTRICVSDLGFKLQIALLDEKNNLLEMQKVDCHKDTVYTVFQLEKFHYWKIYHSYLYQIELTMIKNNIVYDKVITKFGIRTLRFDAQEGFFLNGESVKIRGVCMHHDLGALGSAFSRAAAQRQLQKLIEIGVNGLRCAHNPPDPQLLELCDEYGIVVIDEAFDEWTIGKVVNGYYQQFDECAKQDLISMIKRDWNHPSVIIWSIGNEILEQGQKDGWKVARYLNCICKETDSTRPTAAGLNMTLDAFKNGLAFEVDLAGINYKPHLYEQLHTEYPSVILFGSETASTVSSRGEFLLPAEIEHPVKEKPGLLESSYDLATPNWAYTPEREFLVQDKYPYVFGEFVWTGFDYLGEPTPYHNNWPARSSYFGIYDLAGMEKSRVYSYKSKWTDNNLVHIFPHWNWIEGQKIDIYCYSSYNEVELFLNGKSLGIQKKDPSDEIRSHRLIWKNIPFEKGELKAIAVENHEIFDVVNTADNPYEVDIKPERNLISADGDDLVYVLCTIKDKNGIMCPRANYMLHFKVTGAGEYVAADNGKQADDRSFSEPYCRTFNGKCMVIIRSLEKQSGKIELSVTAEDLQVIHKTVTIQSK